MSDHPLVIYLKKRVEQINYCAYNRKNLSPNASSYEENDDPGYGPVGYLITCGHPDIYNYANWALKVLEEPSNPIQQTMSNNLLVCSEKNKFQSKTILKKEKIMFASPSELLDKSILTILYFLEDRNQIIATIIKDDGTGNQMVLNIVFI